MDEKLTYDELMKLVDTIKMCSGCNEIKLVGNNKTFEELMKNGFPLDEFECENITDFLEESRLYVIPIE